MSESDAEISAAFIDAVEASLGDLVPKDLFDLARRGAAMQWRPIEEAPKDGTHILVTNGKVQAAAYWWPAVWMGTTHNGMADPSHWMPLPPPPKGAEE